MDLLNINRYFILVALTTLGVAALPLQSLAQVTVPNVAAGTEGDTGSATTGGLLGTGAFSNLYMISASQLSSIPVGQVFKGFRVRADGANAAGSLPATDLTWSNYDVTFGQPASGLTLSTFGTTNGTPLSYMSNPLQVRSGSLTVNAGSFSSNGSGPNPFGPLISFPTEYAYQGGDLMILFSHDTATGTGFSVDAAITGFGYDNSAAFAQRLTNSYNPSSLGITNGAPIFQLEFGPSTAAPEPSTLAFLAFGGALVLAKRRRK